MIAGVLLAAGLGTRFTGPTHKLLAVVEGRTVVERALDSMLAAGFDHNIMVTGAVDLGDQLQGRSGVIAAANLDYASGMATSLACGIGVAAELGAEAVVVGLADQPFVRPASWRRVGEARSPIAVATYGGRRGNPVKLGRPVWHLLPLTGDEGARPLLRARPELIQPVACDGFPDDIDTVEDLQRWS